MKLRLLVFFLFMVLGHQGLQGCGTSGSAPVPPAQATIPRTEQASIVVPIPVGSTGKGAAAYGANPLMVKKGTTVMWTNEDTMPHSATSTTGLWDSGVLDTGESFSFSFDTVGSFPYYCTVHGLASMSGVIQVVE